MPLAVSGGREVVVRGGSSCWGAGRFGDFGGGDGGDFVFVLVGEEGLRALNSVDEEDADVADILRAVERRRLLCSRDLRFRAAVGQ
jgi:hypothetical protein